MADLTVSYDYLGDLEASLRSVATLVDGADLAADHSVTGSASVEAAGNEVGTFQTTLASLLTENITTVAASVSDAATTLAEADARLADGAGSGQRPTNPGMF
jgi:hypothetical protein